MTAVPVTYQTFTRPGSSAAPTTTPSPYQAVPGVTPGTSTSTTQSKSATDYSTSPFAPLQPAIQSGASAGLAAGQQALNTGFDPQSALYKQQQQQNTDQENVNLASRGLGTSAAGAGLASESNMNFNNQWLNQQLGRQVQGIGANNSAINTAQGLYGMGGTTNTSGMGSNTASQLEQDLMRAQIDRMNQPTYTGTTGGTSGRTTGGTSGGGFLPIPQVGQQPFQSVVPPESYSTPVSYGPTLTGGGYAIGPTMDITSGYQTANPMLTQGGMSNQPTMDISNMGGGTYAASPAPMGQADMGYINSQIAGGGGMSDASAMPVSQPDFNTLQQQIANMGTDPVDLLSQWYY